MSRVKRRLLSLILRELCLKTTSVIPFGAHFGYNQNTAEAEQPQPFSLLVGV